LRIILAEAGVEYRIAGDKRIKCAEDAANEAASIADSQTECFMCLYLDAKNGMRSKEIISSGIIDSCLVHCREIFRSAIERAASAIVLIHNHPTGGVTPSVEDVRQTRQLIEAGKILDIKIMDHLIVGRGTNGAIQWLSIREEGLVKFE